jgi:small subunit ribosomal protein S17
MAEKPVTEKPAAERPPKPAPKPAVRPSPPPKAARDIGLDVPLPAAPCGDRHCPFHGKLSVRGQLFNGTVVSARMQRTVVVEREYQRYARKFERYEKRTKRFKAHSPPCLGLQAGDLVTIIECRPLAKTVSFVAVAKRAGVAA